jgi:Phosphotransferase enzyme family
VVEFEDGEEIALPKGDVTEGVVRIGDTVRRPRQPQSAFVAAYLGRLESVGFAGAPRFLGVDRQGRDVLDFVAGDVPGAPPEAWACTDEVVAGVARLVRSLHDASDGWVPPPDLVWFGRDRAGPDLPPELVALPGPPELVAHCDVTPQNVVFRDGVPVALIDFDIARPTRRVADLLTTAMWWVPLMHPDDRAPAQRDVDVPARLRLFFDAYGVGGPEREEVLALGDPMWRRSWMLMQHNAITRGGGWARMWDEGVGASIERRRSWLGEHRAELALASRP